MGDKKYCNDCGDYIGKGCDNKGCKDFITIDTKLNARITTADDYHELKDWWTWHRFPAPPIDMLDNLRFGVIINNGEQNICAGFLYFTNARAYALLEYIVSTHKVRDKKVRAEAIDLLLNSLIKIAKDKKVRVLYSSLKNQNLIKHYNNCGFQTGSTNTTEMIKILD